MGKAKEQSPTFFENLSSYFSQFCGATSIHGIQYVGERGRFLAEKLIWTVIITGVCYFCIFLILKTYNKWVTSPVIVTFATRETPIWEIPFPAVTICPEVKTDPDIFNLTDFVVRKAREEDVTEEEETYFDSLSLICNGPVLEFSLEQEQESNFTTDKVVAQLKLLTTFSASLSIVAGNETRPIEVYWLNKISTEHLISTIFTEAGLCYVFNMIDLSETLRNPKKFLDSEAEEGSKIHKWSFEEGYSGKTSDPFPKRTFVPGSHGGARFVLYTKDNHLDYLCGDYAQGFKVMVHHPAELPRVSEAFQVPLDTAVFVGIKPKMVTVAEELRRYKPQDRKCYFSHERPLRFYSNYTQKNCLHECLSNYTLAKCGCTAFHMPKDQDSKICGIGSKTCLEDSEVYYLSSDNESCDCLPTCNFLQYDVEMYQSELNFHKTNEIMARIGNKSYNSRIKEDHYSLLSVYFKEMQFLSSQRHELYGYVDFFANTGGLLGLFIGFSVTSAIEILYFLTLRLGFNISRYGRRFWSGDQELIDAHQHNNIVGL